MASSKDYLEYILEQLRDLEEISYRPMMGEYVLYYRGKVFGGIYDNRLLLKITKASAIMLKFHDSAFPYEGGGEMILFPEPYDAELLRKLVDGMCGPSA